MDDKSSKKQNGTLGNGDGVQADACTKEERIITSGGGPKNCKK